MKMTEDVKVMVDIAYKKYNTMLLSKKETSQLVGCSVPTLERQKKNNTGIPYSQTGEGKNLSNVKYNLVDICKYIMSNRVATFDSGVLL